MTSLECHGVSNHWQFDCLFRANHNRIIKALPYWCFVRWLVDRSSINTPDNKVHGANMGPIWGRQDPGGPHVGPTNFAIWDSKSYLPITYTFCDERTSMSMVYTIQRKAFRGLSKQLLHIIPVPYILDLFIISTGSADTQVPPAWHHWHTQGRIPTGVFDQICFV